MNPRTIPSRIASGFLLVVLLLLLVGGIAFWRISGVNSQVASLATNTVLTSLRCVFHKFKGMFLPHCSQVRLFYSLRYNQISDVSALAVALATNTALTNLK